MNKLALATGLLLLGLALDVSAAHAQLARTFVSSQGSDSNDCNRLTPCRTFQRAHDNTLAAGEITVLDPGGYGAVTITKGISIINDGVGEAGALVSGGLNGITIAAGASDAISLRGLTVKGIGFGGGNGIVFSTGKSLTVENCVIRNMSDTNGIGLLFQPTGSSTLAMSNTLVADNTNTGVVISAQGAGSSVKAAFNRIQSLNNGVAGVVVGGVAATGTVNATVLDSIASNNGNAGFAVVSSAGMVMGLTVTRSVSAKNSAGIAAVGGTATLRLSRSTLTANTTTWVSTNGGILASYGDNRIDGNRDTNPALPTTLAAK